MPKTEHTPGPWRAASKLSTGINIWRTYQDEQNRRCHRPVAKVHIAAPVVDGECEANARLIAAAPDMLAALNGLVTALGHCHDHPRYRAVWEIAHMRLGAYNGPKYEAELDAARAAIAEATNSASN